jgi:hypothetical protein
VEVRKMSTTILEERGCLTMLEFAGVATDVGVALAAEESLKPLSTPHTTVDGKFCAPNMQIRISRVFY